MILDRDIKIILTYVIRGDIKIMLTYASIMLKLNLTFVLICMFRITFL